MGLERECERHTVALRPVVKLGGRVNSVSR